MEKHRIDVLTLPSNNKTKIVQHPKKNEEGYD